MNSDGTNLRDLGFPSFSADWSPDGEMIVFNSAGEEELFTARLDGGPATLLVDLTPGRGRYPRWAPGNHWIGYYRFEGGDFGIWIVRPDGQENHELLPGGRHFSWSPDGQEIVYEYYEERTNTFDLWLFSMESGISKPLFADD